MDVNDRGNSPAAKRRKLDHDRSESVSEAPQPVYIAIAHITLPAELISGQRKDTDKGRVDIKSIDTSDSGHNIRVTASWLKGSASLLVPHDPPSILVIEDCRKLDSITKIRSNDFRVPLACYEANLDFTTSPPSLHLDILWHNSSVERDRINPQLLEILHRHVPVGPRKSQDGTAEPWHVQEFYDNVHVPTSSDVNNSPLRVDQLECELYPFQRRAVRWLLSREGVRIESSGRLLESHAAARTAILSDFSEIKQPQETSYLVNHTLGVVCTSQEEIEQRYGGIRGGLLAEAMGLGKTVEMIALMSLHTMQKSPLKYPTPTTGLRCTGATLIITPPSILEQWKQELHMHAPSLRVYHYEGLKSRRRAALVETLATQDVVLTTYNILAKELHYVMEKPDRNLRNRPRQEPPRSPLDQILWWRVCLDEAQMVESGVSAAAIVARLIPRVNAWAVTGTPIKQSDKDLFGLLLFLKYEPWCISAKLWTYLVSFHRPLFRAMVNEIAIRHSKEMVRDELLLPPQSRHTITVPFSNIEQTHYSQMLYDMCSDCGLNKDGSPANDDWDPDSPKTTEKMRSWLMRLRQTCLHPEVGGRNRKALGRSNGPLRTVQQVLEVMMDQTDGALRTEQREMLTNKIRQGQMFENAKQQGDALNCYRQAYNQSTDFVKECRDVLQAEILARRDADAIEDLRIDSADEEDNDISGDHQHSTARQRLRSALEIKHICVFFMGNIYFQMRTTEEAREPPSSLVKDLEGQETDAYESAKKIRAELLAGVLRKANRQMGNITSKAQAKQMIAVPEMDVSLDDYAGIESRRIFDKLYDFCQAMNVQADQLRAVREKMIELLQKGLVDEDEGVELQGDEYESSTKQQDEMYAYMEALRALHADRFDAVSGQENLLIRSEMKQFLRAAKEGEGPAPELMIKLIAERESKRIKINEQGSLRGILTEIRALVTALEFQELNGRPRTVAEMHIAKHMLEHTNQLMSSQNKSLSGLEQEVASFLSSMNARLEYYKALQKISDTVQPFREEDIGQPINQRLFDDFVKNENLARNKCSNLLAKQRYLVHLKTESVSDSSPRICTICQTEFEIGAITSCGHVFCKEDLQLWYAAHGNCPVCKRKLRSADFYDVTYKPLEMKVQAEQTNTAMSESSHDLADRVVSNTIYSDLSEYQLNQIKNFDIRGASFGSKVDTICRHLQWLREKDPGSKTIIFSQFREFLDVLGRAFKQNNITYSRCDDKDGIQNFKSNPALECFLLHAKAHSAGLNLVVASHVILCEPLINTAIELQAIARVHRIGQHRNTTVWMYLISGTVEETIYEISVRRRLAHVRSRQNNNDVSSSSSRSGTQTPLAVLHESALEVADAKALQSADLSKALTPGRSGGEMVSKEDLWPCLFGNVNKDNNDVSTGGGSGGALSEFLGRDAESMPADGEIGRFLRAEAAEARRQG